MQAHGTHLGHSNEAIIPPEVSGDEELGYHPQADHDGTWTKDCPVHRKYDAAQIASLRHVY